jgi:hypothetical protein
MKTRRLQTAYRSIASKLHRKVGDILRSSPVFSGWKVYQEYPVNRLNPDFSDGRCKFDWVILDLKIVIECHGRQHYESVCFGGEPEKAIAAFHRMKQRDEAKREAAIAVGFSYLVVPYWDEKIVDEVYVLNLVHMYPEQDCPFVLEPKPVRSLPTPYQIAAKERARQYRKQAYARSKEQAKLYKSKVGAQNATVSRYHRDNPSPQDEGLEAETNR